MEYSVVNENTKLDKNGNTNFFKMKKYFNWTVLILGILTVMSFGQQNPEQDFINKAIMSNQYEIAMAQQAGARSANEAIKSYSTMLVDEHQKVLGELQQYAKSKGWTVSDQLDQTHTDLLGTLDGADSSAYDQSFKDAAIASHEKAIALYESLATDQSVQDSTLKSWAADKLPALRSHLQQAKDLRATNGETKTKMMPPVIDTTKANKM